ncbi:MAG: hypothetical protein U1E76_03490 [Planctomycetota bacterium]
MIRRIIVALVMVDLAAFAATARSQAMLFMFEGDRGDQLGNAGGALGDIDGDRPVISSSALGRTDCSVTADMPRVYSGRDGHVLFTFHGTTSIPGAMEMALAGPWQGQAMLNGDGVPDMIVGSPYDDLVSFDSGSACGFLRQEWLAPVHLHRHTRGHLGLRGVAGPGDITQTGSRISSWVRRKTTRSSRRRVRSGFSPATARSWTDSPATRRQTTWPVRGRGGRPEWRRVWRLPS